MRAKPPAITRGEYARLVKAAQSVDIDPEHVRAVVCKDGHVISWFEFANQAHDYVQRRHDPDVRIINPQALAA